MKTRLVQTVSLILACSGSFVAIADAQVQVTKTAADQPLSLTSDNAAGGENYQLSFNQAMSRYEIQEQGLGSVTNGTGCTKSGTMVYCPVGTNQNIQILGSSDVDQITVALPTASGVAAVDIQTANGNDIVNASTSDRVMNINGGSGDDTLTGGSGNDSFALGVSGTGKDTVAGNAGVDTVDYSGRSAGAPIDISLNGVADDGENGENDNIGGDIENVITGDADDTVVTNASQNTITTNGGDDTVFSGNGDDTVNTSSGNDTVNGETGDDILNGGSGNDELNGGSGNDQINGEDGNDSISGDSNNDVLQGGSGNDLIAGGTGNDQFSGGSGIDEARYIGRTRDVTASVDDLANDGEQNENDNVQSDIEQLSGGNGNDTLTGNAGANQILGGAGDDRIDGLGGQDVLTGGAGSDSITSRDDEKDTVTCDSATPTGIDTVTADLIDIIRSDCERVDYGIQPATQPNSTPPPPPAVFCVVPKLTGRTLTQAKSSLKKARCKLGKVRYQRVSRKSKYRSGRIIKQSLRYKSTRKVNTAVSVTIAKKRR